MIAKEAADVAIYLDLFCEAHGIDLGAAIEAKFNEVSRRNGFPEQLGIEGDSGVLDGTNRTTNGTIGQP
jgi:hypothetical protein